MSQNALRIAGIVLLALAAGGYVLEKHVLVGTYVSQGTVTVSDLNPSPTMLIPVQARTQGRLRVYLASSDDHTINYTVLTPSEVLVVESSAQVGRHDFTFDATENGSYLLRLTSTSPRAAMTVKVWSNDNRFLAGCF